MAQEVSLTQAQFAEYQQLKAGAELRELGIDLDPGVRASTKLEQQQEATRRLVSNRFDIVRVADGCDLYYYREKPSLDTAPTTYRILNDRQLKNLVREAQKYLHIPTTATKINQTMETLKEMVEDEVNHIPTDILEIAPGFFWDTEKAALTSSPDRPCFVRLFDNTGFESPSTIDVDASEISDVILKGYYKNTLRWLEIKNGDLPDEQEVEESLDETIKDVPIATNFPFIRTWACHNHAVYMDILKMIAAPFMKQKPMGSFILTGLRRNGKSTVVKLMHTLLGRANTSAVRLSELSDPHKNLTLATTLFNAPDEETEGKDLDPDSVANFKTMASHEPLLLPVMYETKPQWVQTNFVSVSPMNTEPEWKGNSASACIQRSLVIGFHADLSKFDNSGKDFAKETFTPEMFTELLGTVLAIAHYYSDKPLTFSDEMNDYRNQLAEQGDSRIEYADLFNKWFVGYKTEAIIFDDYKAWCIAHEKKFVSRSELMFAIKERGQGVTRTTLHRDYSNREIKAYRIGAKRRGTYFIEEEEIPELKSTVGKWIYMETANGVQTTGKSVVQALENWQAMQEAEMARRMNGFSR